MAQTWAQLRYNSPERAARLRKERRAFQREMKGTFVQQQDRQDARSAKAGEDKRMIQALKNKGNINTQTIATEGAKYIQNSKAHVDTARIEAKTPYWDAAAKRDNASARLTDTQNKAALASLPFAAKLAERAATGPKVAKPLDLGGTNPIQPQAEEYPGTGPLVAPDGWVPPGVTEEETDDYGNSFTRKKLKKGKTLSAILQEKFGAKEKPDMDFYFN